MSEQDFEMYLTLLAKTLRLSDKQRGAIASELRDHLEARLEELTAEGHDKQQAIATALAEFGDASALANDFTTIGKHRHRRRIMQTAFGTIATAAVVAFAVMTLTPNNYQGHPAQPMAGAQGGGVGGGRAPGLAETNGGAEGAAAPAPARGGVSPGGRPGGMASGMGGPRGGGGFVTEPLDLSIHVLDCTEILAPRQDGLDLLERTEALAKAVEQTVATVSAQGPSAIHVRAFEEFLIITATDDAYAQAETLLENISAHVQRRDAIRRERADAETRDELQRLQVQIEETMHERLAMQERLVMLEARFDELQTGGPEALRLSAERDDLANRIDVLQARHYELEAQREQLLIHQR